MKLITCAFFFMDTHGVPLSMQLHYAKEKNIIISLPHFYRDALAVGWTEEQAALRIEEALVDAGEPRGYIDAALRWLKRHRELPAVD
jgi:hypothetical protein